MMIESVEPDLKGEGLRVGIVQARFNLPVSEALRDAALLGLAEMGVLPSDVLLVTVPGALEIPLALQKMAETGEFDALIALGAVIRGETYHFELVSNESAAGISRVGLIFGIPIANGVLTTEDDAQAHARAATKGRESAAACVEMANLASFLEAMADETETGD